MKSVKITYFAILKEHRGLGSETVDTQTDTARELYQELKSQHSLPLDADQMRVAVNDKLVDWKQKLASGDEIVFLPPVAGG